MSTNMGKLVAGEARPGHRSDVILRVAMSEVTRWPSGSPQLTLMGVSSRLSPKDHGDPQRRYVFVD
jgi:hypothetical protein